MPIPTLTALVKDLSLDLSLRIREAAGELVGRAAARHPAVARALLRRLERAGFRGAGWALLVLEISEDKAQ